MLPLVDWNPSLSFLHLWRNVRNKSFPPNFWQNGWATEIRKDLPHAHSKFWTKPGTECAHYFGSIESLHNHQSLSCLCKIDSNLVRFVSSIKDFFSRTVLLRPKRWQFFWKSARSKNSKLSSLFQLHSHAFSTLSTYSSGVIIKTKFSISTSSPRPNNNEVDYFQLYWVSFPGGRTRTVFHPRQRMGNQLFFTKILRLESLAFLQGLLLSSRSFYSSCTWGFETIVD